MKEKKYKKNGTWFSNFAKLVTRFTGSTPAFSIALLTVIIWIITGPLFGFSDTWQLVINTGTTIITFLMVFLIQRSQNKDTMVVQLKLNELIASVEGASNRLIDVEEISEEELKVLQKHYQKLVEMAKKDVNLGKSHSIEEAIERHLEKYPQANK
jgi:low affinity Fe/Cu permease